MICCHKRQFSLSADGALAHGQDHRALGAGSYLMDMSVLIGMAHKHPQPLPWHSSRINWTQDTIGVDFHWRFYLVFSGSQSVDRKAGFPGQGVMEPPPPHPVSLTHQLCLWPQRAGRSLLPWREFTHTHFKQRNPPHTYEMMWTVFKKMYSTAKGLWSKTGREYYDVCLYYNYCSKKVKQSESMKHIKH